MKQTPRWVCFRFRVWTCTVFHVKQQFKKLALEYAKSLDLFGPSVQRDFDHHYDLSLKYGHFLPQGTHLLDVGSGGGLPGIPLALERPDLSLYLCEIRQRKAAFLNTAVSKLKLENVQVFSGNVRNFPYTVSWVTAQAVAEVSELVKMLDHVVEDEWHLITRRSSSWTLPIIKKYSITEERRPLEPDTDLIHLILRRTA